MSDGAAGVAPRARLPTLFGPLDAGTAPPPAADPTPPPPLRDGRPTLRRALALLFAVLALPTCLVLALVTPLGQVADEPAHVMRAASLLHGQWIGRRAPALMGDGTTRVMAGLDVDQAVLGVQGGPNQPKLALDIVEWRREQGWAGFLYFYHIPSVSIYAPTFYAPAAAGMAAAKLAGTGPFVATYAARLANAAMFAAMSLAALLLARRGHALLFCTLSLPIALSLAGSVNQDGLLIAASALAAALLTRSAPMATARPALPRTRSYWAAALLLTLLVMAKPPYAPLLVGLLFPLPPVRSWLRLRRPLLLRAAVIVAALLPGLLWGWFAVSTVATSYDRPPYEAGPLWPGPRPAAFDGTNAAAQLQVLLAEPSRFVTLPWTTIIHDRALLRSTVGVLGWLDILLPPALYALWYLAVPAALLCDLLTRRGNRAAGSASQFLLGLAACVACVFGIYLSQYLSWTAVGHTDVQGPSGRYLLPLLPFVVLSLPLIPVPGSGRLRAALAALAVVAVGAGLAVLPPLIIHATILR